MAKPASFSPSWFNTAKIGKLVQLFGRYVKYLMQSPPESEAGPSFGVMMVARKVVRLPAAKEGTLSKKEELCNHVCAWLEKRELHGNDGRPT